MMMGLVDTAGTSFLERAVLPGISVFKSDLHWTSHSVPGIKSQQRAVQSPLVIVTLRCFKAALSFSVAMGVDDVAGTESTKFGRQLSIRCLRAALARWVAMGGTESGDFALHMSVPSPSKSSVYEIESMQ